MKKVLILLFAYTTLLMGCRVNDEKKNISYNAVMQFYGTTELLDGTPNTVIFKESFLKKNRVRGVYLNENYDPNDCDSEKYIYDSESPKEMIIVIDSIAKHDEIFNHKFEVNFEQEILILRLFSATNCSYSLSGVNLENNDLQIIYKSIVNVTTEPRRTAILIKMDKIEFETIEFYDEIDYNIMNKGKAKK